MLGHGGSSQRRQVDGPSDTQEGRGSLAWTPPSVLHTGAMAEVITVSVDAWLAHLADARDASEHTQRAYAGDMQKLLEWLQREAPDVSVVAHWDSRSLRAFVADMAAQLAPSTVSRIIAALRSFGRFLVASGRLDHDPPLLRGPRQKRKLLHVLDDEEIIRLLDAPVGETS